MQILLIFLFHLNDLIERRIKYNYTEYIITDISKLLISKKNCNRRHHRMATKFLLIVTEKRKKKIIIFYIKKAKMKKYFENVTHCYCKIKFLIASLGNFNQNV